MGDLLLYIFVSAVSCDKLEPLDKTQILEQYNVIGGFATYSCDVNRVFPATGFTRGRVCQSDGEWSEAVEPCERKQPQQKIFSHEFYDNVE